MLLLRQSVVRRRFFSVLTTHTRLAVLLEMTGPSLIFSNDVLKESIHKFRRFEEVFRLLRERVRVMKRDEGEGSRGNGGE